MSRENLDLRLTVAGTVIAAAVDPVAKAAIASAVGGRETGSRVGLPRPVSAVAGPLVVFLAPA